MIKHRIREVDGEFYPQWKIPLLPLWLHFECLHGCRIWFRTLKAARAFIDYAPDVKIHSVER